MKQFFSWTLTQKIQEHPGCAASWHKNHPGAQAKSHGTICSELIETQPPEFQIMVNDMVDQLLDELNRLYNKRLVRINIERVEKTQLNETLTNYKVSTFVFNIAKDSSVKLMLTEEGKPLGHL